MGPKTLPKALPTRAQARRGKFPSTFTRRFRGDAGHNPPQSVHALAGFEGLWHGTRRVLDPGAKRRANKRTWRKAQLAARSSGMAPKPSPQAMERLAVKAACWEG